MAAAEKEHLDAGLPARLVAGDHIGIDDPGHMDVLVALHQRQRADAVADQRGGLEIERLGRFLHLHREALLDIVAAARQKQLSLLDQPGVFLAADAPDAGRAAALDLEQQARAGPVGEDAVAARAQQKRLLQGDQRAVDRAGRGERPEIGAGLVARAAKLGQLRKIVIGGQVDERERFVVAQQDVVARHQPLDQIALEQQRLGLGGGDDDFERGGLGHHPPQPVRQPGRMGIVLHPALQIARLADVERIALAVEHAVDAGAGRHVAQRRPQYRDARRSAACRRRCPRIGAAGSPGAARRQQIARQRLGAAARVERRRLAPTPFVPPGQPAELPSDISALSGISTKPGDNSVEKLGLDEPQINQSLRSNALPKN